MFQKILAVAVTALVLAACGEDSAKQTPQQPACDSVEVVQTVRNNIQEIITQEARAFARNDSRRFVDADKIIAAAAQLDITLTDATAVKDGNQMTCNASLNVQIPNDIMSMAYTNSPLIYGDLSIPQLIEKKVLGSNLLYADNRFTTSLRYTPQANQSVHFADNTLATTAQTVSAALLPYGVKSILMIDGQAVSKEDAIKMLASPAPEDVPQAEISPEDILENNAASRSDGVPQDLTGPDIHTEVLIPNTIDDEKVQSLAQSELEQARKQNHQAEAEITDVWNGMERTVQQGILSEQREWIKGKTQNCMQAAASADSPAQAEYLRLQCDTRMTRERTQYLRGFSIN